MYTDPNFEDTPVYDHSSVLEKCYQLKHDNESLKEENVKLQYQLESAEETIKKSSTQLIILGQKLSSLSDAAEERDKLLEFWRKKRHLGVFYKLCLKSRNVVMFS
ncbi:unnamed protein product [Heterobilharzia americana]|nr:unnamed protein product [Heterobilharzia americana]